MSDVIPTQAWLVLLLAVMAAAPAIYVWRHLSPGLTVQDITQPPQDLGWRSTRKLYGSLATLLGILAVGVFIFTPWAEDFANSESFLPSIMGAIGAYAVGKAVIGFREGKVELMLKGFNATYDRDEQPGRYWASVGWNAVLGGALIAASVGAFHDSMTPRCDDYTQDKDRLPEALLTCNALLSEASIEPGSRARLLHARGRVQHRLGNNDRALADYTAALEIEPDNSYTLFNRGLIHARVRNLPRAIEDLSASIELRPDNDEAYLERGVAYLDSGMFREAVADMSILHQRDANHDYALANRGIAYAWLNDARSAEADFSTINAGDPAWPVVLRGRAILAQKRRDYRSAIALLTEALRIDPNDQFSLRHRADAYWKIGQQDLARDDDDRLAALQPPPRTINVAPHDVALPSEAVTE